MAFRSEIDAELMARARELYEGSSIHCEAIAALLGLPLRTFHTRRKEWGWIGRSERRDMNANAMAAAARQTAPVPDAESGRGFVAAHIRAAVEREVAQTQSRLRGAVALGGSAEAERAARTLASLVKTLNELKRLEPAADGPARDEYEPRDMDEFRRDLARRLEALCEEREGR